MKIKFILLSLVIIIQLFLPGCWDYSEYESMLHIIAIGVDFDNDTNEITATIQYIPTIKSGSSKGSQESKTSQSQAGVIHSATDKTFYDALSKLQQVSSKKLFFGYQKIIVIGENAAKYKMKDIMELQDRSPAVRDTIYLVIVAGKAEDTIGTLDAEGTISSGQEIYNLIELSQNTGASYPITIQDFIAAMAIGGLEAIAPHITTTAHDNQQLEAKGGQKGNLRFDEQREGDQIITGTAAFKGDKLAGWLDDKESLGYGWITGKKIQAYKTSMKTGESNELKTEYIAYLRISKSKSKIKVQIDDGKPIINLDINTTAQLRKYYEAKGSYFISPEEVQNMEKELSESIRSDIIAALAKAQKELKSDIFGFGFALFRKDPKLWQNKYEKKWDDIFPNMPVNINVTSKIINSGTNIKKLDIK